MRIQDSFYYQDYSYVVKVGESINTWRDAIKSTVHPLVGQSLVKLKLKVEYLQELLHRH